eukprot:658264-Pelagomonas_calceolata.AAC.1
MGNGDSRPAGSRRESRDIGLTPLPTVAGRCKARGRNGRTCKKLLTSGKGPVARGGALGAS